MRLLAIDTALANCSAAVLDDSGGVDRLVVASEEIGRGHAERLMDMIGAVLADAELGFAELDRVVVTVGPGSFTGVRVGVAMARGLGLVLEKPVIGVTTLAAIAHEVRNQYPSTPVAAVLDAKRGELYGQIFSGKRALCPPVAESAAAFAERLPNEIMLIGSAAPMVAEAAGQIGHTATVLSHIGAPTAAAVARLGREMPATDVPPSPLYLRPPDAKPQEGARIARA
ncbi:MAG: tRNA (adenosine(37)-N6)-threonylcarbamoyltransferase complex dimerization subunit type 1 TsaB [Hyphomicrobiales bacterium]|nr:MAG: tRNA (adenosine(37)-N6)-threonylcarbamoyltransferase complex dimerization subunit type 1 TsaB [Hyphomicrobiales bacterium]